MSLEVSIRNASKDDIEAMLCLYSQIVVMGTGSLDLRLPSSKDIERTREYAEEHHCPCFVAEVSGEVVGFAYVLPFSPEQGYVNTVRDFVFVHPEAQGDGVGTQLLTALIAECESKGYRQMIAYIGDKENKAAIALHENCKFERVGELKLVGWKLGRWLDTLVYQRVLQPGDADAPTLSGEAN